MLHPLGSARANLREQKVRSALSFKTAPGGSAMVKIQNHSAKTTMFVNQMFNASSSKDCPAGYFWTIEKQGVHARRERPKSS